MTTTDSTSRAPLRPNGSGHHRRRLALISAAALVVVVALAAIITTRALDHRYGPIQQGNTGGLYSEKNFVFSKDGSTVSLATKADATGELFTTVANLGSHSVKVNSVDTDDVVASVQWSAYRSGRTNLGADTPWHAFPAIVPAHGSIRLLITIRRPNYCRNEPANAAADYYGGIHTVHWESLLHDHTSVIDDLLANQHIRVC